MNAPQGHAPIELQANTMRQRIKAFYWLIKREFWEHRRGLVWMPVILGAAMNMAFLFSGSVILVEQGKSLSFESPLVFTFIGGIASLVLLALLVPSIVIFAYCVSALHADRQDRSVFFWKSLPVSDADVVVSKALVATVLSPAIVLGVLEISHLLLVFSPVFATAFAATAPSRSEVTSYALLPLYAMWMLPTVGWLFVVSAFARTQPALWAIAIPLATGSIAQFLLSLAGWDAYAHAMWSVLFARLLLSVVPGSWLWQPMSGLDIKAVEGSNWILNSWQLFSAPSLWIGAFAGILMIAMAIRLRRWRTAD